MKAALVMHVTRRWGVEVNTATATLSRAEVMVHNMGVAVEGKLALPPRLAASNVGILFDVAYELELEFDVPLATDPVQRVPVTIVHSVNRDGEDRVPPLVTSKPHYKEVATAEEFAYEVPPMDRCLMLAKLIDRHYESWNNCVIDGSVMLHAEKVLHFESLLLSDEQLAMAETEAPSAALWGPVAESSPVYGNQ